MLPLRCQVHPLKTPFPAIHSPPPLVTHTAPGQPVILSGPSGAGKSTVLKKKLYFLRQIDYFDESLIRAPRAPR